MSMVVCLLLLVPWGSPWWIYICSQLGFAKSPSRIRLGVCLGVGLGVVILGLLGPVACLLAQSPAEWASRLPWLGFLWFSWVSPVGISPTVVPECVRVALEAFGTAVDVEDCGSQVSSRNGDEL